jgi:hypothetical protein
LDVCSRNAACSMARYKSAARDEPGRTLKNAVISGTAARVKSRCSSDPVDVDVDDASESVSSPSFSPPGLGGACLVYIAFNSGLSWGTIAPLSRSCSRYEEALYANGSARERKQVRGMSVHMAFITMYCVAYLYNATMNARHRRRKEDWG